MEVILTVIGIFVGGIGAYYTYRQYRTQQEDRQTARHNKLKLEASSLPELDDYSLGESFHRYFAAVLNRPFYPLPNQLNIIEKVKDGLTRSREVIIVVLFGAGGVGKTTIAGEIIRQTTYMGFLKPLGDSAKLHVYEDAQIRWIEEPASLKWEDLLNTILHQLGSPSLSNFPLKERENWIRRQLHLEKYLVLVDNLESNENAHDIAISLRELLAGSGSRALITYRYTDLSELRGVRSISVTGLSTSDSLTFLGKELEARGYAGLQEWLEEKGDKFEILLRLVDLTRGLPLALQLIIGLRITLPLASVYDLLREVKTDTRVEEIYEFLYREELRLLSCQARNLLISAFSKQSGYFRSELVDVLGGLSSEEILSRLAELGRVTLIYSINRERPGIGAEEFFYVHPMLHQLLNKAPLDKWITK